MISAEEDLGIRPYNKAAATRNSELLTSALENAYPDGRFAFRNRKPGPVLTDIGFLGKEYYFNCGGYKLRTGVRTGGRIKGSGGSSTPLPSGQYFIGGGQTYGGCDTIFTRLDPLTGGPFFLIRNQNFGISDVNIYGQEYVSGFPQASGHNAIGFEIEGRDATDTGHHMFNKVSLCFCNDGIVFRNGYYNNGFQFVENENHANDSSIKGIKFFSPGNSCIKSYNQQAVNWDIDDCHVGWLGEGPEIKFLDIVKGGDIYVNNLKMNYHRTTLIQVQEYTHYNAYFNITNLKWDGMINSGDQYYMTLFKYNGPLWTDMSWVKWTLRVTGHFGEPDGTKYDESKLIIVPTGRNFNVSDMLFDIRNLPTQNFDLVGSGPWYRPKQV